MKRIKERAYNGKPNNPFEIKFLSEFLSSASTNTVRASHVQSITVSLIQLAAFCFLFIPSPPFCHIKVLLKCESTPKSFSPPPPLRKKATWDLSSRNRICWRSVKILSPGAFRGPRCSTPGNVMKFLIFHYDDSLETTTDEPFRIKLPKISPELSKAMKLFRWWIKLNLVTEVGARERWRRLSVYQWQRELTFDARHSPQSDGFVSQFKLSSSDPPKSTLNDTRSYSIWHSRKNNFPRTFLRAEIFTCSTLKINLLSLSLDWKNEILWDFWKKLFITFPIFLLLFFTTFFFVPQLFPSIFCRKLAPAQHKNAKTFQNGVSWLFIVCWW